MNFCLENEKLIVNVNSFGGELSSIVNKRNHQQYLWNGDAMYWKRCAPVLFPFVGSLKNKKYTYKGKTYSMGQHGFARDMKFVCSHQEKDKVWFSLTANKETLSKYPFLFNLEIGYVLLENTIKVVWKVKNEGKDIMYYSIGGHPAFMCPLGDESQQTEYYISFDNMENIKYGLLSDNGLLAFKENILETKNGLVKIDKHMFDQDALIIEDGQASCVKLLTPEKEPYLGVKFDTPLFGLWSPAKKNAPFVCIEPWYGRCDQEDFYGSLEERDYERSLEAGQQETLGFEIEIY